MTGEHSGIDNPNMPSALADVGVTTFAADAPASHSPFARHRVNAPRYPSNIYYNASNWPDEINEYSTLYVASQTSLDTAANPTETGHCDATSDTTCVTTLPTEADPCFGVAHHVGPRARQQPTGWLRGPDRPHRSGDGDNGGKTVDYGYTILDLIDSMLSQYNSWYTAPIVQMTDVSEASTLAEQAAWATAVGNNSVSATDTNGMVTVTNNGTSTVNVPVTAPTGTTVNGTAFGEPYGGALSGWTSLASGASLVPRRTWPRSSRPRTEPPRLSARRSATPSTRPASRSRPSLRPARCRRGDLRRQRQRHSDHRRHRAPAAVGATRSRSPPRTQRDRNQTYTLANAEAPTITSPTTANFTTGVTGTYSVTTTGYPAPTLTELGTLPTGVTFTDNGNGTATITGTPAAGSAASYPSASRQPTVRAAPAPCRSRSQ